MSAHNIRFVAGIPYLLCLCCVETLESHPVHSFNGGIISSARVCTLQSSFIFLLASGKGCS